MQVTRRYGRIASLGALLIAALPLSRAAAVTTTSQMQVTANVQATCTVSSGDMAFGAYQGGTATPVDATATITATCPPGQTYTIGLNAGLGGGTTSTRMMTLSGGGATLNYGLFTETSHTTNWDDIGGTTTHSGTGDGSAQAITVYGRIPAGQNVRTGLYEDTITVTMDY
jgi:spore coat protein U-like protein